jgi:CRISPR-associated RAMP protein (TIGR02581 family)
MHKRLLNEVSIEIAMQPDGPILIKAGEKGDDPTLPDMEFVRTNGKPYLPGSSLKGVIRSHCERLARTVGDARFCCDPLHEQHACGTRLHHQSQRPKLNPVTIHARSCFVCRLFGNTSLASRFHITDASLLDETDLRTEERNGVAIDRVYGSVAVGPFNYETVTHGTFHATIFIRNFGLAQLGLLALTLRDIQQQRVRIGFAKSRGLGTIMLNVRSLVLRYPTCTLQDHELRLLGGGHVGSSQNVLGIGAFPESDGYDFDPYDTVPLPVGVSYVPNEWDEPEGHLEDEQHITAFWRASVGRWREEVNRWAQPTRQGS